MKTLSLLVFFVTLATATSLCVGVSAMFSHGKSARLLASSRRERFLQWRRTPSCQSRFGSIYVIILLFSSPLLCVRGRIVCCVLLVQLCALRAPDPTPLCYPWVLPSMLLGKTRMPQRFRGGSGKPVPESWMKKEQMGDYSPYAQAAMKKVQDLGAPVSPISPQQGFAASTTPSLFPNIAVNIAVNSLQSKIAANPQGLACSLTSFPPSPPLTLISDVGGLKVSSAVCQEHSFP